VNPWGVSFSATSPFWVSISGAGASSATIALSYGGQQLTAQARIAASAPGIFTANASGSGQAIARNPDGTVNSASNPAPAGLTGAVPVVLTVGSAGSQPNVTISVK